MNCKFMVVVTVWSDEKKAQVEQVAGMFATYINAKLFADSYAVHYCAQPKIVELGTFIG